ncbi:uncharacterized protein LOC141835714 [Curcuma longa]|uniref:uncharacterized protein LOC141835714 n=1 Tax=Curcuma longa TaxID=136217 RepID=UPI003D9E338F
MSWMAKFDGQRTDYANEIGDVRERHEFVIADLESQLRDAKAAMENELAAARRKCIPCGEYMPLEEFEFNQQCWTEYLNACLVNNFASADRNEENAADAVEVFGEVVRRRHLLDFIMQGERQNQLQEYVNAKIGQFKNVREGRAAKRLRDLWETVSLESPAQTPPRVPIAAGGENPDGVDPQADADRNFNMRFADPGEHTPIAAPGPGAQAQTHHPARPRTSRVQQGPPCISPPHTRSGKTFGRGFQGNPLARSR